MAKSNNQKAEDPDALKNAAGNRGASGNIYAEDP